VLAVGDVGFRAKCYNYIAKINKKASVVFVSHAMQSVGRMSSRAIVMKSSKIHFDGDVSSGIQYYYKFFESIEPVVAGSGRALIHDLKFKNANGAIISKIKYGDCLIVQISASVVEDIKHPIVYLCFYNSEMRVVAEINSRNCGIIIANNGKIINIDIVISSLMLNPGTYKISCCVYCDRMQEHCAWNYCAWDLIVEGDFYGTAPLQFKAEWIFR